MAVEEIDYLYNGQYGVTSDANGLYYMCARYYNIDIKRFINQDILTGGIDSSKSLNRYAYMEGNPISYLDPFGLSKQDRDKIDTSLLHYLLELKIKYYAAATAISIGASFVNPTFNIVTTFCSYISGAFSTINGLVYMYDAANADTIQECARQVIKAISNFASAAISFLDIFGIKKLKPLNIDDSFKDAINWVVDLIKGGVFDLIIK